MPLESSVLDAPVALDQQLDQRKAHRQPLREFAIVSVLGTASPALHGEIRNISKGGTQLLLEQSITVASLVGIKYSDDYLLGEVIYCHREQAGWLVGVRVEHALFGLTALAETMNSQW